MLLRHSRARNIFYPWYRGVIYTSLFVLAFLMLIVGGPGSMAANLAWVPLVIAAGLAILWYQGESVASAWRAVRNRTR